VRQDIARRAQPRSATLSDQLAVPCINNGPACELVLEASEEVVSLDNSITRSRDIIAPLLNCTRLEVQRIISAFHRVSRCVGRCGYRATDRRTDRRPSGHAGVASLTFVLGMLAGLPTAAPAQGGTEPRVVLRPGDIVRLKIWLEPDLSGDVQVDSKGKAVFPQLGTLKVADIDSDSLKSLLVGKYAVYLNNPVIDVTPLRRISIVGAVKNPGLYPIDPTITLADAIALAGGVTSVGTQDKVVLMRSGDKIDVRLRRDLRIVETPVRSGDQLYVPERSWLSRNPGIIAAAVTATGLITAALLR
jgi:protein involved in polysaccharide export with SLBB domain